MTSNLAYEMYVGETYLGSKNDGSTFTFTATGNNANDNAEEMMNGNTKSIVGTNSTKGTTETMWYYTWYAATAGVGTSTDDGYKDINGSICPTGWRLPPSIAVDYGGKIESSIGSLLATYNIPDGTQVDYSTVLNSLPLSFIHAGTVHEGTALYVQELGFYWESTATPNSVYGYQLGYGTNNGYPATTSQAPGGKMIGVSVRCVAL